MARPFKLRQIPTAHAAIFGLLKTLDLPKRDTITAEVEIFNRLSASARVTDVSKEDIFQISKGCLIDSRDILAIGVKVFRAFTVFCLNDCDISSAEKQDLNHIVHIFSIPKEVANRNFKEAGRYVFKDRLKESISDGIVTQQERDTLIHLKKILGIEDRIPEEGVDWSMKFAKDWQVFDGLLKKMEANAATAQDFFAKVMELRADIAEHTDISLDHAEMESIGEDTRDLVSRLADANGRVVSIEEKRELICEAKDHLDQYDSHFWSTMQSKIEDYSSKLKGPIIDPDKEYKDQSIRRKRINERMASEHGFRPKGSPKQISWANDIIAETFLTDPLYSLLKTASEKSRVDDEGESATRFLMFLKNKSAGWWINSGQEEDFNRMYRGWKQSCV